MVVEVVLAHNTGALRRQQPAERVADRGPAGAADVDGPGGVGRDELEIDVLAVERVGVSVGRARFDDVVDDHALGGGSNAQVDEAGACHVGGGDTVGLHQRGGEPAGQLTRVRADLLAQLKREIRGVVAVVGVARALDGDRRRQC